MENKYFKLAGNLDDDVLESESRHFSPLGDLDSDESRSLIVPGVEENKYFKPLRNLDDTPISMGVEVDGGYFKKAGDLDDGGLEVESRYFSPLGDLGKGTVDFRVSDGVPHKNGSDKYFMPAGDLGEESRSLIFPKEDKGDFRLLKNPEKINVIPSKKTDKNIYSASKSSLSSREIDDYLLTVVSGKKYAGVCELGVLMSSGRMIASFEQLKRMVDEGYNIVSAQCINAEIGLIEVEFQKYVYDEELMERRRRF